MSGSKGSGLVQHALQEDDEDPRADCKRLRDPQAHDTNPYAPKANYVPDVKPRLRTPADAEPTKD